MELGVWDECGKQQYYCYKWHFPRASAVARRQRHSAHHIRLPSRSNDTPQHDVLAALVYLNRGQECCSTKLYTLIVSKNKSYIVIFIINFTHKRSKHLVWVALPGVIREIRLILKILFFSLSLVGRLWHNVHLVGLNFLKNRAQWVSEMSYASCLTHPRSKLPTFACWQMNFCIHTTYSVLN